MRAILGQRPLRFVFAANVISMLGSGMNSAAVAWYILQATHSEMALGTFAVLQTIPAMLMLPFTGVIIDREDRRRLVMWLDAVRAVIIVTVAILAFRHRVQVWQLYLMNTLVAAGFWMFWPTITALIQELTPEGEFVQSNTFLLAGVQGGWLIAGSLVGFMYNHIGLGGVLLIDVSTYVVSFLCYFAVRKGRHVVLRPEELRADILRRGNSVPALLARDARGPALSARSSRRRAARNQLGAVSRRHDHRSRGHSVAERAHLSCRSRRLRLAQRRLGHRRIPQRACTLPHDRQRWADAARSHFPWRCCRRAWSALRFRTGWSLAIVLYFSDGLGARRRRHRHEHQPDGNGPAASDGTSAERLLFLRNIPATRACPRGRRGRAQGQPGGAFAILACVYGLSFVAAELAGGNAYAVAEEVSASNESIHHG